VFWSIQLSRALFMHRKQHSIVKFFDKGQSPKIIMKTYYGAVADYGTNSDVFICMVDVYDDEEVSIIVKRVDQKFQVRVQQIPEHQATMTPKEELAAVGSAAIPKKAIVGPIETEIREFLKVLLQVTSIDVKKLRQTDLAPLF
jgi:hypothetical protein